MTDTVSGHYDALDRFYRRIWGEHIHHGLWSDSEFTPEEAVRHLVHRVAHDANLTAGSRICDIGCGYGAPARLWARDYGARVTGFTVSEAQYAYARRQSSEEGPAPRYKRKDFLENDLASARFDAVVAIESLTHIADQKRVFDEAARILRPGGRLVACVWMASATPAAWERRFLLDPIIDEGRLSGLPTAEDLHDWAVGAGFSVDRVDDVTGLVRRTWTVVIGRFLKAVMTDPDVVRVLFDSSVPDRIFARTILRIWVAQRIGTLRYGWLVAHRYEG